MGRFKIFKKITSRTRYQNRIKGIALIELVIVFFIISVLASYSIDSYLNFASDFEMKSITSKLEKDINFARENAILFKKQVIICALNKVPNICYQTHTWNNGYIIMLKDDNNKILRKETYSIRNKLDIHWNSMQSYVQFNEKGEALGYNGTFVIKMKNKLNKLILSPMGKLHVDSQ